tara:strand:+ start:213 stop:413 length:201 start_codon:yes stop_codon:yes gene_type:complete
MGKTRRRDKTLYDSFHDLDEFLVGAFEARKGREKKQNKPKEPPREEDSYGYDDEDFGSFEKMGKRK